jgi:hypothetical protein
MYFKFISDLLFLNFSEGSFKEENIKGAKTGTPEKERKNGSNILNVNNEIHPEPDQETNSENDKIKS